jgi:DNA-binding MarR family transcriptional regulator
MTLSTAPPLSTVAAERISVSAALRLWLHTAAAHDELAEVLATAADEGGTARADVVAILLPLAEADEQRLRMNELADRSHLTPSGLTRRIDRLVVDGLVRRVTCPSDRRGAHAQLTPLGLDVARRSIQHLGTVLERHVSTRLSAQETAALSDLLVRLSREQAPD